MNKRNVLLASVFLILTVLVFPMDGIAQPPPMLDSAQAPIDGGLSILAVGGGLYALKKMKSKSNK
ncbi:hypothetical protein EP331_12085 [bacterium]|nr:MAG: hypothetical protein EP331_12085 [bacterium]